MNACTGWMVTGILMLAGPAWADCGFCGKGGTDQKGEHTHAHAEIGKPAPDFTLKDLDGTEHKLSALKGRVVVLEWTNHECPFVKRCHAANLMKNTLAKFKNKPVVWLAIDSSHFSNEKRERIRKWAEETKIEYPILLDAPGKVGHVFGAKTTPHMFVIDRKGVLAYTGAIDDDAYGQKDTKRNYVEEAVTALLNGSTIATATTKSYGCSIKYKQ